MSGSMGERQPITETPNLPSSKGAVPLDALVGQLVEGIDRLTEARTSTQRAVSLETAARMLGLKEGDTVRKLARHTPIRLRKTGNRYIVSVQSIEEFLGDRRRQ